MNAQVQHYLNWPIEQLLEKTQQVYNPEVAHEVLTQMNRPEVESLPTASHLEGAIELLPTLEGRHLFLAHYLVGLEDKIAATADCGCWYSAEQGIPCEHDWALARGDVQYILAKTSKPQGKV